ncbi:MAG: hypothetical protein NTW59_04610 [Candidatus Diapherotrites archaeon]|nr:hypothetical protein [Candidatus Diapherotrites archaeon]
MADSERIVETIIALVIIVASFMFVYDALVRISKLDVLLAVIAFGGGLVYLFNNIQHK